MTLALGLNFLERREPMMHLPHGFTSGAPHLGK